MTIFQIAFLTLYNQKIVLVAPSELMHTLPPSIGLCLLFFVRLSVLFLGRLCRRTFTSCATLVVFRTEDIEQITRCLTGECLHFIMWWWYRVQACVLSVLCRCNSQ